MPLLRRQFKCIELSNHSTSKHIRQQSPDLLPTKKRDYSLGELLQQTYQSLLLFGYLSQLLLNVKIPTLLGKLVVCDRYICDTLSTDFAVNMNLTIDRSKSCLRNVF